VVQADDDGEELHEIIGAWGAADEDVLHAQGEIDLLTGAWEEIACDEQWAIVEQIRAAIESQYRDLLALVARYSFDDGRRFPQRPGEHDAEAVDPEPLLDEHVLANPTMFGMAIDAVLQGHPGLRGLAHGVSERWKEIRHRLPRPVWRQILRVEELSTHRAATAQGILARWAYRAGARSASPRR
jgi:hypothetical protein